MPSASDAYSPRLQQSPDTNPADGEAHDESAESKDRHTGTDATETTPTTPPAPKICPGIIKKMDTFIRPSHAPNLGESVRYSANMMAWLLYNSLILAVIPLSLLTVLIGSTRFFPTTRTTMLRFFVFLNVFLILTQYLTVFAVCLYIFGRERVGSLSFKVLLPLYIPHALTHSLRIVFEIPALAIVCFLIFVFYFYAIMHRIQSSPQVLQPSAHSNRAERSVRYESLASDGTPMALFKGFAFFTFFYFFSTYYLIPYFMEAVITVRIIGRVLVLPCLFNIVDTYQSNLLIYKSKHYLKYRMVSGNVLNSVCLAILRLMITDSPNLQDTMVMAASAGFFEVVFRVTAIPRTIFAIRLLHYLKRRQAGTSLSCFPLLPFSNRGRVANFNNIQNTASIPESGAHSSSSDLEAARADLSWSGMKDILLHLNRKDDVTNYILTYHTDRAYHVSMFELQSSIYIPLILYLCRPIRHYVTFETFTGIHQMAYSVLIQFSIEIFTQLVSLTLENYFYGIEIPMVRSLKYNVKAFALAQFTLVVFIVVYLSTLPFFLGPESWPSH